MVVTYQKGLGSDILPRIQPFEDNFMQYDNWFIKHDAVYRSELKAVRMMLPGGRGIEIGVGSGRFAGSLGIQFGVEPSGKMRELAQARGINAVEGVAEDLPYPDSQFDFALMVTTICFVDDLELSFREAYRVLKGGGSLVIGFVDRESPLGMLYEKNREKSVFYRSARFYSVKEVILYLEKTGFQDLEFSQTIFKQLNQITDIEPVKTGYGQGSFVVIKAYKP